ncbi:hypothetical protein E2C01_065571 [Portunus trituberculatus]|uniref:Uncharacterized protein n=1 Tax=Portunus trituberculatus TaxID=210409 RepID=A0A5B7HRG4_PORTR|nr:hypothetical protein [Portunus trituberculatus]
MAALAEYLQVIPTVSTNVAFSRPPPAVTQNSPHSLLLFFIYALVVEVDKLFRFPRLFFSTISSVFESI